MKLSIRRSGPTQLPERKDAKPRSGAEHQPPQFESVWVSQLPSRRRSVSPAGGNVAQLGPRNDHATGWLAGLGKAADSAEPLPRPQPAKLRKSRPNAKVAEKRKPSAVVSGNTPWHPSVPDSDAVTARITPRRSTRRIALDAEKYGQYAQGALFAENEFARLREAWPSASRTSRRSLLACFRTVLDDLEGAICPFGTNPADAAQRRALDLLTGLRGKSSALVRPQAERSSAQRDDAKRNARARLRRVAGPSVNSPRDIAVGASLNAAELERSDAIRRLFPRGVANTTMGQGELGNCTYMATFLSVCQQRPDRIENMIQLGRKPGELKILSENHPPVYVNERRFSKLSARGDLGPQIFERVYAHNQKTWTSRSSRKIMNRAYTIKNHWAAFLPGQQESFQPKLKVSSSGPAYFRPFDARTLWNIDAAFWRMAQQPSRCLGTMGTKSEKFLGGRICDSDGKRLQGNHRYAIVKVDMQRAEMILCNPHDSRSRHRVHLNDALRMSARFDFMNALPPRRRGALAGGA